MARVSVRLPFTIAETIQLTKRWIMGLSIIVSGAAFAQDGQPNNQGFDQSNLYGGAGISTNDLAGHDDAIGRQIFGGYEFDIAELDPATLSLEAGYFDSGDFEDNRAPNRGTETSAEGLWTNAVISHPLAERWNLLGRAGVDFGDDDGFMAGIGLGYDVNTNFEIRGEVVSRDDIDSLQANFVYHF